MEDIIQAQIILGAITAILILLGILFRAGKALFLIPGYNSANEQERAAYNLPALTRFASLLVMVVGTGFGFLLAGVSFDNNTFITVGGCLIPIACIAAVVYCAQKDRFKK